MPYEDLVETANPWETSFLYITCIRQGVQTFFFSIHSALDGIIFRFQDYDTLNVKSILSITFWGLVAETVNP